MRHLIVLLTALALVAGCGSSSRKVGKGGKLETPKLPPVKPEALKEFDAGMRALRLGGPDARAKAEPRLRAAAKLDKNLWEAWLNLGVVYFENGEDGQAVDAFSKALDVNPAATEARLGRAEAARRDGDDDLARKDYRVLIRERPTVRLHYARLASLLRSKKKYEAGLDVLREALRQAGADTQIYVELALIYMRQGRDELAE
ncbi:MAG: tetratricopeptide repeat protein, partial [Deltaproteobacteria bacterium]|nr:tetratricopeptide repeat protein [Deltaproteobacteria bacterium]